MTRPPKQIARLPQGIPKAIEPTMPQRIGQWLPKTCPPPGTSQGLRPRMPPGFSPETQRFVNGASQAFPPTTTQYYIQEFAETPKRFKRPRQGLPNAIAQECPQDLVQSPKAVCKTPHALGQPPPKQLAGLAPGLPRAIAKIPPKKWQKSYHHFANVFMDCPRRSPSNAPLLHVAETSQGLFKIVLRKS